MFRDDFVWGVASSAYQVEGRDPEDGCGKMIWDTFIEEGRIPDGKDATVACDHIHRYKEDYKMMRLLGIKAYRFSVSWTRIMPQGTGSVNEKAIALYRDMILEMKKNGITPYLTMYHWELPQALQDKGGWLNEEIIQWFGEYAKVVAENFSDICEYFITLNEPQCFVGLGHLSGIQAPGLKLSYKETFQIAHNALRAHGQAVINLRKYAKQPIKAMHQPVAWHIRSVIRKKMWKQQERHCSLSIIRWTTGPGMWHGSLTRYSLGSIRKKDWRNSKSICRKSRKRI